MFMFAENYIQSSNVKTDAETYVGCNLHDELCWHVS